MSYSDAQQIQDLADAILDRHLDSLDTPEDPREILQEEQKCCECGARLDIYDYQEEDIELMGGSYWVHCHSCNEDTDLKEKK